GHARVRAPVEHRGDVVLVAWEDDDIGWVRELAPEGAHDVTVGLAVRVAGPLLDVGGADTGERRRRRHARRAEVEIGELRRRSRLEVAGAEAAGDGAGDGGQLVRREGLVVPAPAPPRALSLAYRVAAFGGRPAPRDALSLDS